MRRVLLVMTLLCGSAGAWWLARAQTPAEVAALPASRPAPQGPVPLLPASPVPERSAQEPAPPSRPTRGGLCVEVCDAAGVLCTVPAAVFVRWERKDRDPGDSGSEHKWWHTSTGRVEIDEFPPGMPFSIAAELSDGSAATPGPRSQHRLPADGSGCVVRLRVQPVPLLTGRLVRAGGEPVASQQVEQALVTRHEGAAEPGRHGFWMKTDADGRFAFRQRGAPAPGSSWSYEFALALDTDRLRAERGRAAPSFPLSAEVPNDLGTIVLVADPELTCLASGRVLDAAGRAVLQPSLSLGRFESGKGYTPVRVLTRMEGQRFVLLGWPAAGTLTLSVGARGQIGQTRSGTVAELQDLEIRLGAGRTLTGRVELDPSWVAAAHEAGENLLFLQAEDSRGRHLGSFYLLGSGPLRFEALPPDEPVHVQIRAQRGRWVLAEVRDVRGTSDRRLDPLRLLPPPGLVRVRLQTPDGAAFGEQFVGVRIGAGLPAASLRTDRHGKLLLAVPAAVTRLELVPNGHAPLGCVVSPELQVLLVR